jgi:amidase
MEGGGGALAPEAWSEATIEGVQQAIADGRLTAADLVLFYMERMAELDSGRDGLSSIIELNPDALHIAAALDRERALGGLRGPLHGIPVLLKDNIDTGDHMHTSAGSLALATSYAAADAPLAARLREAGAILLGKANMTEWANFMSDHMPAGYSSRGGQVRNPYGPGTLEPGGSSSGSAVAVAANLTLLAVGTETSGSILSPASQNGIVGIKPTVGLVSRTGVVPISHTQDTAGPMARTVRDAALLLDALAGVDRADPVTATQIGHTPTTYTASLDAGALRGARLGVAREPYFGRLDAPALAVMEAAIARLAGAGAEVVDPVVIATADSRWNYPLLVHEFKPALNAYLAGLGPNVPVHTLRELIAYDQARPDAMLRYGQDLFLQAEATSGRLTEPAYVAAIVDNRRRSRAEGIDRTLAEHRLDAIVFPNNWGAGIAAAAGYPSVTVPAGQTDAGAPVGLTLTAGAFSEARLIALAYAFEAATAARRAPAA